MSTFGRAPSWGSAWKAFVMENADRTCGSYLQKTTLPYEGNYLDLHPTITDPLGDPVCRITADYRENEHRINDFIQDRMEEWFREAGAIDVIRGGPRHDGSDHPRLRWHPHGRQPGDQRRGPLGLRPRGAEPRRPRRVGHGDERRPQPDAYRAGPRLAHGRAPGRELAVESRDEMHRHPHRAGSGTRQRSPLGASGRAPWRDRRPPRRSRTSTPPSRMPAGRRTASGSAGRRRCRCSGGSRPGTGRWACPRQIARPSSTMTPSSGGQPLTTANNPSAARTSRTSARAIRWAQLPPVLSPGSLRSNGSHTSAPAASSAATSAASGPCRCWVEKP